MRNINNTTQNAAQQLRRLFLLNFQKSFHLLYERSSRRFAFISTRFGLIFCSYMDNSAIKIESGWLIIEKCNKYQWLKCKWRKNRKKVVKIEENFEQKLKSLRKILSFSILKFHLLREKRRREEKSIFKSSIYLKFLLRECVFFFRGVDVKLNLKIIFDPNSTWSRKKNAFMC